MIGTPGQPPTPEQIAEVVAILKERRRKSEPLIRGVDPISIWSDERMLRWLNLADMGRDPAEEPAAPVRQKAPSWPKPFWVK